MLSDLLGNTNIREDKWGLTNSCCLIYGSWCVLTNCCCESWGRAQVIQSMLDDKLFWVFTSSERALNCLQVCLCLLTCGPLTKKSLYRAALWELWDGATGRTRGREVLELKMIAVGFNMLSPLWHCACAGIAAILILQNGRKPLKFFIESLVHGGWAQKGRCSQLPGWAVRRGCWYVLGVDKVSWDRSQQYLLSGIHSWCFLPGLYLSFWQLSPESVNSCFAKDMLQKVVVGRQPVLALKREWWTELFCLQQAPVCPVPVIALSSYHRIFETKLGKQADEMQLTVGCLIGKIMRSSKQFDYFGVCWSAVLVSPCWSGELRSFWKWCGQLWLSDCRMMRSLYCLEMKAFARNILPKSPVIFETT